MGITGMLPVRGKGGVKMTINERSACSWCYQLIWGIAGILTTGLQSAVDLMQAFCQSSISSVQLWTFLSYKRPFDQ